MFCFPVPGHSGALRRQSCTDLLFCIVNVKLCHLLYIKHICSPGCFCAPVVHITGSWMTAWGGGALHLHESGWTSIIEHWVGLLLDTCSPDHIHLKRLSWWKGTKISRWTKNQIHWPGSVKVELCCRGGSVVLIGYDQRLLSCKSGHFFISIHAV